MIGLLNASQVRKHILLRAQRLRPGWDWTRVSQKTLDECEATLMAFIDRQIQILPSSGKTIKFQ